MMQGKEAKTKRGSGSDKRVKTAVRRGELSLSKARPATGARARAASTVRIIGGAWKRTPLPVADAAGLRPTPDRVRETLFNWLAHLLGDFTDICGLDLFAGTGALGFELASRAAREVVLVESQPTLVAALERTRAKLGASSVRIVSGDALAVARRLEPASFDVIFLDPPFDSGLLAPALTESVRLLRPDGVIYVEHRAALQPQVLGRLGLAVLRAGRAGQVHFELVQRA